MIPSCHSRAQLGAEITHYVSLAGLELKDPPASASQLLGLKCLSLCPASAFVRQVLSLNPNLTDLLNWLAMELLRSACVPTPSLSAGVVGLYLVFIWVFGIHAKVLMLMWQAF